MKILFLAANPVNVVIPLRIDEEFREIDQKIRLATHRDQLKLVPVLAVRVGDLQAALLTHQPDIVHFGGHCRSNHGIILEDEAGHCRAVKKEVLAELFSKLNKPVRLVVLNACYASEQAQALSTVIDFTIGMNTEIGDRAAIVFAPQFYQLLAFGRSVKDAFDMAVLQLKLEESAAAHAPELLERDGADAAHSYLVSEDQPRPAVSLPELLASLAFIPLMDVSRRFLINDSGWPAIAAISLQLGLILLATIAAGFTVLSLARSASPLVRKAASLRLANQAGKTRKATLITLIALVIASGLWLSLPAMARYYNERGARFQYSEQPDLTRAREAYQRAVRLNPSYAPAYYNLALAQEDLQPEQAMNDYLLAIKYDGRIYPAYNNLARLYLRRGQGDDPEQALSILSQAVDLSPQDETVQYSLNKNLGWANYILKHYTVAETYLRRAISLRQEQGAAAHCLLAYVLKAQGKAGVDDECFYCVGLAPGEKDVEAKWVSDAQECLMKGGSK